jgi:hypothetical protein
MAWWRFPQVKEGVLHLMKDGRRFEVEIHDNLLHVGAELEYLLPAACRRHAGPPPGKAPVIKVSDARPPLPPLPEGVVAKEPDAPAAIKSGG